MTMRNENIRPKLLLLSILILGLTLAPAMLAQQRSPGSAPAGEAIQDERPITPVIECPRKLPDEYIGGEKDQFVAPFETPQLSPALQQYYIATGVTPTSPTKPGQYDEGGQNKWRGQSFF